MQHPLLLPGERTLYACLLRAAILRRGRLTARDGEVLE